MQEKNTESVNWAHLRKQTGLTLQQAAARSGYGVATINGLEKRGEGSQRLKLALAEVYGLHPDYALHQPLYKQPFEAAQAAYDKTVGTEKERQAVYDRVIKEETAKLTARREGYDAAEALTRQDAETWRVRALEAEQKVEELKRVVEAAKKLLAEALKK